MISKRPNVILMFVDDLGYGDVSCLNPESKIRTPNIDALAERGTVFTDAHATSALCTPSRYGLLTGRYNWRSSLKQGVLLGGGAPLIEPGRKTMANLFRDAGYTTACVGKWHLGMGWTRKAEFDGSEYGAADEVAAMKAELAAGAPGMHKHVIDMVDVDFDAPCTDGPIKHGFDYFYGLNASLDQPPYTYIENDRVLEKPGHLSGVWPLDRNGATQQQHWQRGPAAQSHDFTRVLPDMQEKVLALIDRQAQEPFFIYYPTPAVHGPLLPTPEFAGKSGLNAYADVVLMVDSYVGQITELLKRKGIWEDTIFLFTSDNGCSGVADYPFLLEHGHNPSYVFRGKKADIWEGGHRVPTILSWPGRFAGRANCDALVCLSDFFRSFAQLTDQTLPDNAGEDSVSLLPLLDGSVQAVRDSIIHSSADGSFSIREKNWKLELCPGGGGMERIPVDPDAWPCQLYDLQSDIAEQNNLAPQMTARTVKMTTDLIAAIENGRTTPGARQANTPSARPWHQYEALKKER